MTRPTNINPVEWELALSMARTICARYFASGGTARDALTAYGLMDDEYANWQIAIESIACAHCQRPQTRAA